MDERSRSLPHHVILEGRSRLSVAGVEDVESFDEQSVVCSTSMGALIVKGENLHIDKLSIEDGELSIEGSINAIEYEDTAQRGGGFWSRMFR